jgi:hypothetical protein
MNYWNSGATCSMSCGGRLLEDGNITVFRASAQSIIAAAKLIAAMNP